MSRLLGVARDLPATYATDPTRLVIITVGILAAVVAVVFGFGLAVIA